MQTPQKSLTSHQDKQSPKKNLKMKLKNTSRQTASFRLRKSNKRLTKLCICKRLTPHTLGKSARSQRQNAEHKAAVNINPTIRITGQAEQDDKRV